MDDSVESVQLDGDVPHTCSHQYCWWLKLKPGSGHSRNRRLWNAHCNWYVSNAFFTSTLPDARSRWNLRVIFLDSQTNSDHKSPSRPSWHWMAVKIFGENGFPNTQVVAVLLRVLSSLSTSFWVQPFRVADFSATRIPILPLPSINDSCTSNQAIGN